MLKVSDAFNSAFSAPDRELRARVTIGKTVYDSDDLTSINYDSGAMTGEQFSIGSTYMNSAKIIFSHLVEGLKQLDEVLVEFGVLKPDGTVEYVKMGTFIVDDKIQMDRNNNTTTIECMDRMTMLGGAYVSKLTYPARIKDVAVEIANMAGVKANETSFARLSENKINQPTGYTYRDAIGLIAQFQMGFALFDRDGLLDIRTLQDNSFKIDPNQYFLKGLVKNETFFKLNGISCTVVTTSKDENGNETSKTTVLQSGSSSGTQIKLANNVMTQDVLDRMYEALKFTNYYPFSLNWNGNPAVEAGDWLTVEDLQGNEFKVPNMSYTLTYNGGLTATSKADTSVSSPATYSYGGTISNIVNEIGGRESAEGNHIYEGTEDQEPTLSKEGDLWYKHVGPDTEEWIYKDGKWEFLTSTKTANDAADAADKASKEAEEAKKTANESVSAANDAVAKAGFANDTATQAKSDAATAGQQAKDALTSAGTAITDAQNALTNSSSAMADSAQARKDSAAAAADATTALTDAKKALTDSGSAQVDSAQARKDSATAKIQAANAATQANQAVTDASTAKADAAAAKGQAANALGQANTAINNAANALDKFNNMQVGGVNLLLDTDFNNLPKYWTASGTVTGTFNGHNIIYCDAKTITGDFSEVLRQTIYDPALANNRVLPSRWYTLSFYSKGVGKLASYVYAKFVDSDAGSNIDGVKSGFAPPDGSNIWDLTDVWTRHTYTFKSKSSFTATDVDKVLFRAYKGNTVYICMPQLEAGTLVTDYSPAPEDVQQQFTNIDGELASKVNQTTYNVLAGTVDTVNTLAKQNQSTISTLATKTSVDTVNHTATTAQTLAQQNANELLNKASTNTVDTLTQRVTTAESTLSQTATKAELSLTKTDVDKLGDTVNKQATQLALTATKAELQVAQTNVDNLKKTVTSNTAGMTANANALKLKADSSTVSSLDGRVTNLSGQLDVQADKIAATVTANDVTGMLNGYATQTWTQSQIKTTADQINLSVSKVQSNLDNMQIGSRNLLIGTKDFSKGIYAGNGAVVTSEIYNGNRVLYEPKLTDANSYHNPYNMTTSINADATVYTVSFYAKSDVNGMVTRSYFYSPTNTISSINSQGKSGRALDGLSEIVLSNKWEKYWITWTTTPSDSIKHIILGRREETVANSDIGGIYLTSPMFVEGNKPLPWSPAPEDLVTDVEFAELAVKVDGITATVASKADKTQITQLSDQIKLKADTTAVNTLKGTVDKQGSEITLNTNSIKLKADQSSVDALKGTVDKQDSAIDVNTKAIALKANQSTVDTLTGRVSTAEGKITVQADQIAQTVSKTELTNILGDYATQTWTQSQIKSTADQINLSVVSLKTEVENNGAENLIQNSSFKLGKAGWSGWEGPYIHDPVVETYHSKPYTAVYFGQNTQPYADLIHDGKIPLTPSTSYVFQIKTRSLIKNHAVTYIQEYDAAGKVINDHAFILNVNSPDYITNVQKFTTSAAAEYAVLRIRAQPGDQFMASELMLTEGTIVPKSWYPSSMDNATTADFASLEITIKGIQSTVTTKADQSQVTQLAGQITSVVGSTSNPNLVPYSGHPKDNTGWSLNSTAGKLQVVTHVFYENSGATLFNLTNNSATEETIAGSNRFPVKEDKKYTISGLFFAEANVVSSDIWFLSRPSGNTSNFTVPTLVAGAQRFSTSKAEYKSYTFTMPHGVNEGYIRIDNNGSTNAPMESGVFFGELKMELGDHATPWVYNDSQSQITQLSNDINLRVQKGDVINQINISPESILIAGQKVHITGQTSIDNAVIKDAMIADIKADKITAGTLNAANVNVINLNANNITTGTLKGANLSMNLNTGEILFQRGSIKSTNGKLNIDINDGTLSVMSSAKSGVLFNDGNMYLSTVSGGWFNPLVDKPKYGSIKYTDNFLNTHPGMTVTGSEGLLLLSGKDANVVTMMGPHIAHGLGILLGPDNIYIGGDNNTAGSIMTGGKKYQGYLMDDMASVSVGNGDSFADTTLNGKTINLTFSPGKIMTNDQGGLFRLSNDERSQYVLSVNTYNRTYASGATMTITPNGVFGRISSASKYKLAIGEITTLKDEAHQFLSVKPKQWFDKSESEALADMMTTGNTDYVDDAKALPHTGFIAEDLYTAGLDSYVIRGSDGSIESIQYDRLPVLHHELIRELFNRLDAAETEIYRLKQEAKNAS